MADGSPLKESLASKGYDVSGFTSDEQVLEYLGQAAGKAQQIDQLSKMAQYGQQYLQHAGDFQEYLKTKDSPAVQPESRALAESVSESGRSQPETPAYDSSWENLCDFDAQTRRYVVKPEYQGKVNLSLADDLTHYKKWEDSEVRNIVREFDDRVKQAMPSSDPDEEYQKIQEAVDYRVNQIMQQRDNTQRALNYVEQNLSDLYQLDEGGRPKMGVDGQTPELTERGQIVLAYSQHAAAPKRDGGLGLSGVQLQDYAIQMADAEMIKRTPVPTAPEPAQEQAPPQPEPIMHPDAAQAHQIGEEKKENYLAQKVAQEEARPENYSQNRDAGLVTGAMDAAQQGQATVDFRSMLEKEFKDAGLLSNTG